MTAPTAPPRHHPFSADQFMAQSLGVCWHSPTADRWPCTPVPPSPETSILCPDGHRHSLPLTDATCWLKGEDARRDVPVTKREYDVAQELLRSGSSNAQIGKKLYLSEDTVKSHIKKLLMRSGATTRSELIVAVFRNRLRLIPTPTVGSMARGVHWSASKRSIMQDDEL